MADMSDVIANLEAAKKDAETSQHQIAAVVEELGKAASHVLAAYGSQPRALATEALRAFQGAQQAQASIRSRIAAGSAKLDQLIAKLNSE